MQQKELTIAVDLGTGGKHTHRVYTCDLSREYITINADYHT
jgi:N-acetylglutamate synthase/N-acetylornithine aminotransferase